MDGHLRRLFRQNMPEAQWTPIETGATAAGVPDCEFCFPGGLQGWVEFKASKSLAVGLRPEQVSWLLRRSRIGGRCFVAVRRDRELFLYSGAQAADLRDQGLRLPPIGRWSGQWRWPEVRRMLVYINPCGV